MQLENNEEIDIELARNTLKKALNHINRSFDNNFLQLITVKLNTTYQITFICVLLSMLFLLHNTPTALTSPYYFYCAMGALGGSLSSILSTESLVFTSGGSISNLIHNVLLRPVVGLMAGLLFGLMADSVFLIAIINKNDFSKRIAPLVFEVADRNTAMKLICCVAGFGGEKLLGSTMDQLVLKLSAASSKNKENIKDKNAS